LVTDDDGVLGPVRCFELTSIDYQDIGDARECRLRATVHFKDMVTDLGAERRGRSVSPDDHLDQGPDEYDKICVMIFEADRETSVARVEEV